MLETVLVSAHEFCIEKNKKQRDRKAQTRYGVGMTEKEIEEELEFDEEITKKLKEIN